IRIDFSTGGNAQSFPEIANKVIIAGPAEVTVAPITGATLFITYRKESNEGTGGNGGGGGGGGGGSPSPTVFPFFFPTPTPRPEKGWWLNEAPPGPRPLEGWIHRRSKKRA